MATGTSSSFPDDTSPSNQKPKSKTKQGSKSTDIQTQPEVTFYLCEVTITPFNTGNIKNDIMWIAAMHLASLRERDQLPVSPGTAIKSQIYLAGEAFGVPIPGAQRATPEGANARLLNALRLGTNYPMSDKEIAYHTKNNKGIVPKWTTIEGRDSIDVKDVPDILAYKAANMNEGQQRRMLTLQISTMVAFATQGKVSPVRLPKIAASVNKEMGTIISLDAAMIEEIWKTYKVGFYDPNALQSFVKRCKYVIGSKSTTIKNMLYESETHGLTGIIKIKEALGEFREFPWTTLAEEFPEEWLSLNEALELIKATTHYGYMENKGLVNSSNYMSFLYTAIELKIKVSQEYALKNYRRGEKTIVGNKPLIDKLVREYVDRRAKPKISAKARQSRRPLKL